MKILTSFVTLVFFGPTAFADTCTFETTRSESKISIKIEDFAGNAHIEEKAEGVLSKKTIDAKVFASFKTEMKKLSQSKILKAEKCAAEDQLIAQCTHQREMRTCMGPRENEKLIRLFNAVRAIVKN